MKITTKSILISILAAASFNANALKVNLEIDPSFMTPDYTFAFDAQMITCNNQLVCNDMNADSNEYHNLFDYNRVLKAIPGFLSTTEVPAHSSVTNADSFVSLDIIKDGVKMNIQGCTKVLNGLQVVNINITPTRCDIS